MLRNRSITRAGLLLAVAAACMPAGMTPPEERPGMHADARAARLMRKAARRARLAELQLKRNRGGRR